MERASRPAVPAFKHVERIRRSGQIREGTVYSCILKSTWNRGKLETAACMVLESPFSSVVPRCGAQIIDDAKGGPLVRMEAISFRRLPFGAHPGLRFSWREG